MNIVWFSWKDKKHPLAGGAETITDNLLSRLASSGHNVTLLTSRPEGLAASETINGYKIIRDGGRYSVYLRARSYYKKQLRSSTDLVIEEVNTVPFFTKFYAKQPSVLFFHQLARKVWFYQIAWPVSWIGYMLEPLYLRLLASSKVITVSKSTQDDLRRYGFKPSNIKIIREAIALEAVDNLGTKKFEDPTMLCLGSVRPMKRTLDAVRAFNGAKADVPNLRLIIAGDDSDSYAEVVRREIAKSPYAQNIKMLGRVNAEERLKLMRKSWVIVVTSIKEGWGLIVTEANSQGTPAVVYNVDGLRDSVKDGITGVLTAENPAGLGRAAAKLVNDPELYQKLRQAAWQEAKQYTKGNSYADFIEALGLH